MTTTPAQHFPKWFMWGTDSLLEFASETEGTWHPFKVGGQSFPALNPMLFYVTTGAADGFIQQISAETAADILNASK